MKKLLAVGFAVLFATQFESEAMARRVISDGGNVSACGFDGTFGTIPTDGAVSIPIGIYDSSCAASPTQGFSLNIGGTFYDQMFVNENGIVSFGAPIGDSPATPLGSLTSPAFAPFFADGANTTATSLKYGWTDSSVGFPNSIWLTWDSFTPEGDPNAAPNIFQLGIVDLGAGDFDLIFNYESINWDSPTIGAQAGVVTSLGAAFLLPGAGIPGAYFGTDDISSGSSVCNSATPSTALACNKINDGSQAVGGIDAITGLPSNGYYLFKFRDGVLLDTPVNEIPLPPAAGLFLLGAAALGGRKLFKR
jgi:hypothetical protein